MCVIIARQPGVNIPFEKIESACRVNPHGYGVSVVDRGRIETVRKASSKEDNNPEEFFKLLEDAKDHVVVAHLRFRTAGEITEDNAHPFSVIEDDDGEQLVFAHNGTMYKFKDGDKGDSDTRIFVNQIVKPISSGLRLYYEKNGKNEPYIFDDAMKKILMEFAGTGNKFVLCDAHGNILIVNRKEGKDFEGWWASNEYSFNRFHREPAKAWKEDEDYGTAASGGYWEGGVWRPSSYSRTNTAATRSHSHAPYANGYKPGLAHAPTKSVSAPVTTSPKKVDAKASKGKELIRDAMAKNVDKEVLIVPSDARPSFCELADLSSLDELCLLSRDVLEELCLEYPEMAALALMDLLHDRKILLTEAKYRAAQLKARENDKVIDAVAKEVQVMVG